MNFYEILEIPKTASQDEIKRSYRKKAKECHPDKGGDPETFKKLNAAYEILSDPEKRKIYDERGIEGLQETQGMPDLSELFGNLGGFFNFFQNMNVQREIKTHPIVYTYNATLEDLCVEKVARLRVSRQRICECVSKSNQTRQGCQGCKGQGKIVKIIRVNQFMNQQSVQQCGACSGSGLIIPDCDKAGGGKECHRGLITDSKVFEVQLKPDFSDGHIITFSGEGNQCFKETSGDFVVVIKLQKHPEYEVHEGNLYRSISITLKEALCGFETIFKHPSGKEIKITREDVTKPHEKFLVQEAGMTVTGKMVVEVNIVFPDEISSNVKEELRKLL